MVRTPSSAIYQEGELTEDSACKEYLQVRHEGSRRASHRLKRRSLKVPLAVGYRVRSPRRMQPRQRAATQVEQCVFKGFAMDELFSGPQPSGSGASSAHWIAEPQ